MWSCSRVHGFEMVGSSAGRVQLLFKFVSFNQRSAYDVRISDWSSDVCSSDLRGIGDGGFGGRRGEREQPVHQALTGRRMVHDLVEQRIRRSEEHTSELQSLMRISYAVFCLKKKNNIHTNHIQLRTNNETQLSQHKDVTVNTNSTTQPYT